MNKVGRLFSFSGRTGRLHYWQVSLALEVMAGLPYCLFLFLAITLRVGALAGLGLIALVVTLPAYVAVSFRRLHDRNKCAWWWLVFFGPLITADVMAASARARGNGLTPALALFMLASLIPWLWGTIELGFIRGTKGANRFGPDPYASLG